LLRGRLGAFSHSGKNEGKKKRKKSKEMTTVGERCCFGVSSRSIPKKALKNLLNSHLREGILFRDSLTGRKKKPYQANE